MHLNSITVTDFKNIREAHLDLAPRLNGLLGCNGMGKSNLLDAIYALSFTKSFTGAPDSMLVRTDAPFFMLRGLYERRGLEEEVTLGLIPGKKKSLKRKGVPYKRMAEHVGAFPLVMVSPRDGDLVRGTGTDRRRWLDMVISQSDSSYLEALMRYNNALEQRNRLLHEMMPDRVMLEVLEMTLDDAGMAMHRKRCEMLVRLEEIFSSRYAQVSGDAEQVKLTYESPLNAEGSTLMQLLEANRQRDMLLHHTSVGPHRDDIVMTLNGMNVRQTASEGQSKSFTIALRFAQYEFLREATKMRPLLLLDDIFDKLDATRVSNIISLVSGDDFGQIFITDTNRKHLDEIFGIAGGDFRLWNVDHGNFTRI